MPTANVISTNPRDRSSFRAKATMAIAANTIAEAPTIRLNSSEPTPRIRVSYAPRKMSTEIQLTMTTSAKKT